MDSNRTLLFAILFIGIIVGSNVIMYFIARSSFRKGDSNFLKNLRTLGNPKPTATDTEKSMDELRQRIQELNKNKPE
jgi:hypothetical protein